MMRAHGILYRTIVSCWQAIASTSRLIIVISKTLSCEELMLETDHTSLHTTEQLSRWAESSWRFPETLRRPLSTSKAHDASHGSIHPARQLVTGLRSSPHVVIRIARLPRENEIQECPREWCLRRRAHLLLSRPPKNVRRAPPDELRTPRSDGRKTTNHAYACPARVKLTFLVRTSPCIHQAAFLDGKEVQV